jgi:hypothetical protein
MSTEFTLEDVLDFLDTEEQEREFIEEPRVGIEKEQISSPKGAQTPEDREQGEEAEEAEEDEEREVSTDTDGGTHENEDLRSNDLTEDDDNQLNSYYEFLKKNNVLVLEDDFQFDGTPEAFESALEKTKENLAKQAISALWSKLNPDFQAALKFNLDGGNSFEEFANVYGKKADVSNYDLNSIEDQKKIVRNYYKQVSNYTDDRINKFVNKLIETEDLRDEAEEALEYLKTYEQEQKAKLLQETEQKRTEHESRVQQWRESIVENINTSQIPDKRKSKVQAFILNPIQKGDNVATDFERTITNIFQNPDHYIQLADFLSSSYDPKKGLDFSRFIEKDKTKVTSKFQKELEDALKSPTKKGGTLQKPNFETKLDWDTILTQLDK